MCPGRNSSGFFYVVIPESLEPHPDRLKFSHEPISTGSPGYIKSVLIISKDESDDITSFSHHKRYRFLIRKWEKVVISSAGLTETNSIPTLRRSIRSTTTAIPDCV